MNKEDYVQLHTLLAKLMYELMMDSFLVKSEESKEELNKNIEAVEQVMKLFIVECE